MSRLKELYGALDTLRNLGLSLDDIEQKIADAEEEVIKNDILPVVTETIASSLQQVQREMTLVIKYVPGAALTVHLSRQGDLMGALSDIKEVTLPDPPVDYQPTGPEPPTRTKAKSTMLRIKFADGRVIDEPEVAETFRKFVIEVGVDRVRSLGIVRNRVPLVSNTLDEKYKSQQRDLGNGWYLMTCTTTSSKMGDISNIAKRLGIDIEIETYTKS